MLKNKNNGRRITKVPPITPVPGCTFMFYFNTCTIPTKFCFGLSLHFILLCGVVSLLNQIIFLTTYKAIFLPPTRNGMITVGPSFDT
jgi:hypothetical protein